MPPTDPCADRGDPLVHGLSAGLGTRQIGATGIGMAGEVLEEPPARLQAPHECLGRRDWIGQMLEHLQARDRVKLLGGQIGNRTPRQLKGFDLHPGPPDARRGLVLRLVLRGVAKAL